MPISEDKHNSKSERKSNISDCTEAKKESIFSISRGTSVTPVVSDLSMSPKFSEEEQGYQKDTYTMIYGSSYDNQEQTFHQELLGAENVLYNPNEQDCSSGDITHLHSGVYSMDQVDVNMPVNGSYHDSQEILHHQTHYTHTTPFSSSGVLSPIAPPLHLHQLESGEHSQILPVRRHKKQNSNASTLSTDSTRSSFTRRSSIATSMTQDDQRPLISTVFWEDEKTICYQVEYNGFLISRREDNNYVNGTKLLNASGMSRGKRDGMLKQERSKYIVRVGPMSLKGVWIPLSRACEIARNQGLDSVLSVLLRSDLKEFFHKGGLHLKRSNMRKLSDF